MNEKIRQILVPIATLGVIFINYLAATGAINNVTPEVISDKYQTILTPAGYAFSIWSLIYLGVIAFSIYQLLPSQRENPHLKSVRTLYILSCAANCGWIFLWHYDYIVGALGAILILLASLFLISVKLTGAKSSAETWFAKIPFSIYFGWVTAASLLNFSIALVYLGIMPTGNGARVLGVVLIAIAVVFGILMRFKFGLPAHPLAVAWALTAIAVANGGETAIVVSCAIGVIVLLLSALSFIFMPETPEAAI